MRAVYLTEGLLKLSFIRNLLTFCQMMEIISNHGSKLYFPGLKKGYSVEV